MSRGPPSNYGVNIDVLGYLVEVVSGSRSMFTSSNIFSVRCA